MHKGVKVLTDLLSFDIQLKVFSQERLSSDLQSRDNNPNSNHGQNLSNVNNSVRYLGIVCLFHCKDFSMFYPNVIKT